MNKRILKKKKKQINEGRMDLVFQEIAKRFTVASKTFGNGYFLYDLGPHSICHFTLKETPDWRYGIWALGDDRIFAIGECKDFVDKFKPSATYLSYKFSLDNMDPLQSFIEDIGKIQENPKLYLVDSLMGDAFIPCEFQKTAEGEPDMMFGYQVVYSEGKYIRDESITQEQYVREVYQKFEEDTAAFLAGRYLPSDEYYQVQMAKFDQRMAVGVFDKALKPGSLYTNPRYEYIIAIDTDEQEYINVVARVFKEKADWTDPVKCINITNDFSSIKSAHYLFLKDGMTSRDFKKLSKTVMI